VARFVQRRHETFYAARNELLRNGGKKKKAKVSLHWVVVGKPLNGFCVDHISGDTLDNRRENLRVVTYQHNQTNMKKHRSGELKCVEIKPLEYDTIANMKTRGRKATGLIRPHIVQVTFDDDEFEFVGRHSIDTGLSSSAFGRVAMLPRGWREQLVELRKRQKNAPLDKLDGRRKNV